MLGVESWRVAPVPMSFPNHVEGAPGPSHLGTGESGTTTYNFDNMDRLSSKVTPEGTLSYTYDAAGNLASITSSNANGASMSYSYDNLNQLSSVTDKVGTTTYTYDGASNLYRALY